MAKKKNTTGKERPTSRDVSRLAGVSQATVSRAFTNGDLLTPETRQRVFDAANQLGYIPNAIARSMVSSETNLIGIVVFQNESPFQRTIVNMLAQELRARGRYAVMIYQGEDETQEETIQQALMYRVDGIFITEAANSAGIAELCASAKVPVVLVSREVPGAQMTSVSCDDYTASGVIAEHLYQTGHRRVACLLGTAEASTTQKRLRGFMDKAEECGINVASVMYGDYSYQSGKAQALALCGESDQLPEALFCSGDIIALGAMDALRSQLGLRIPEDISVIGFDDIAESDWLSYSLTTITQPVAEMVNAACDALITMVENPGEKPPRMVFDCVLCQRNSVGKR